MPEDDLFSEDGDEAVDDFDRLTDLLFQRIDEFAEEEDVADEILPLLLLRLAVTMRMVAYAATTAKPSGGGLNSISTAFAATSRTSFARPRKTPIGSSRRRGS